MKSWATLKLGEASEVAALAVSDGRRDDVDRAFERAFRTLDGVFTGRFWEQHRIDDEFWDGVLEVVAFLRRVAVVAALAQVRDGCGKFPFLPHHRDRARVWVFQRWLW